MYLLSEILSSRVSKRVWVSPALSQTDYLHQFSLHPFKGLWWVSQVQSLNSISLLDETQYVLQLYRIRGTSQCWAFLYSPIGDILCLRYCIYENESSHRSPSSLQAYCFGRFASRDYVGYAFSSVLRQGAEGVQEVLDGHPQGFSYSHGSLRHLSHGFKGARRIFFSGVSLHV